MPKVITCLQLSLQRFGKQPRCASAYQACCEFVQENLDQDQSLTLILGRQGERVRGRAGRRRLVLTVASAPQSWAPTSSSNRL